jgi:hypothetical protein
VLGGRVSEGKSSNSRRKLFRGGLRRDRMVEGGKEEKSCFFLREKLMVKQGLYIVEDLLVREVRRNVEVERSGQRSKKKCWS